MKRTLTMLAVAGLVLAWAGFAYGDMENDASCHVFVNVDPNIGVMPLMPYFDLGSVQTGPFTGIVPFRIDANTEQVRIQAAASYLYKGNDPDPDTLWVDPILLLMEPDDFGPAGIEIMAYNGNPIGGASHRAIYSQQTVINGFPGWSTEYITFESAQNNHFSQQVDLYVTWIQDDPEKPMGEYSGAVAIYAGVVLPPYVP
jgi:hypothetical protein